MTRLLLWPHSAVAFLSCCSRMRWMAGVLETIDLNRLKVAARPAQITNVLARFPVRPCSHMNLNMSFSLRCL